MADKMPGTSAQEVELAFLGANGTSGKYPASMRRYPIIALKLPWTALQLGRRLRSIRARVHALWTSSVQAEALCTPALARGVYAEALAHFYEAMRIHVSASWLAQTAYTLLARLAARADMPGMEQKLATGYGSMEETRLVTALWDVSRARMHKASFLQEHGFHGPVEGDMSSRSWREDVRPLDNVLDIYHRLGEESHPARMEARRVEERRTNEAEVLARLPAREKMAARKVLNLAHRFIPLREVGKAAFVQAIDVGRASARALGAHLVAEKRLSEADDVFYLTSEELLSPQSYADACSLVEERRRKRVLYQTLQLPKVWQGQPVPISCSEGPSTTGDIVRGVGVSPGVITAKVCIVRDLSQASIEPGEILVCETTDPAWVPLFVAASGLVIDIGGPLSHGAIVARELGIPCVINTKTGTQQLRTGDLVQLDGGTGIVTRLQPA
jgi:pyruvate,water dikinase